jgi:hypothetical protein
VVGLIKIQNANKLVCKIVIVAQNMSVEAILITIKLIRIHVHHLQIVNVIGIVQLINVLQLAIQLSPVQQT